MRSRYCDSPKSLCTAAPGGSSSWRRPAQLLPFAGIYGLFRASLAADRFETLILSGFGLATSAYGLPDIGFIGWGDLTTTTSHVARTLERCGASGVVLEDQTRARRCGHLDGKQLLPLPAYLNKLEAVLADRSSLVVARSDASDPQEIFTRVQAYEQPGRDAMLPYGLKAL